MSAHRPEHGDLCAAFALGCLDRAEGHVEPRGHLTLREILEVRDLENLALERLELAERRAHAIPELPARRRTARVIRHRHRDRCDALLGALP